MMLHQWLALYEAKPITQTQYANVHYRQLQAPVVHVQYYGAVPTFHWGIKIFSAAPVII